MRENARSQNAKLFLFMEYYDDFFQESLRQNRMTRFILQQKEDPHGPSISLYVGNLPTGLSQRQYEKILVDIIGKGAFCYITLPNEK